ncbi:cell division protein FtsZ [candidate division KSB1 bacterium]|nr:cell division protein FtsZ [candidate division KSB1 bacterium]
MKSIIEQGIEQAQNQSKRNPHQKDQELQSVLGSRRTVIKIVGTGGAGNNTLTRLTEVGIKGVETIAVNTDAQDLLYAQADIKILIGKDITNGLGAGSNPQIGEDSARENEQEIRDCLTKSDMVFITCGLGGGTGTGAAPVVAEIAKASGALTIAVVTLPFSEEGEMRWANARSGLEKLQQHSDTVIIIQNDKLLQIAPDLPLGAAFKVADEVLVNAVKGIAELVTEKGLVNLDFADVRAIMKDGGTAMIGIGESNTENRAADAIEKALNNPLLDVDITGAQSALLNITGGMTMTLKDTKIILKALAEHVDQKARVIWGARTEDAFDDFIRVLIIVTGLKKKSAPPLAAASNLETEFDLDPEFQAPDADTFSADAGDQTLTLTPTETAPRKEPDSNVRAPYAPTRASLPPELAGKQPPNPSPFKVKASRLNQVEIESNRDFSNNTGFDIRENDAFTENDQTLKTASEVKPKRVFTEIFEEDTQADLNILIEAIENFEEGVLNLKMLKDMKIACDALKNTAQLFGKVRIEQFTQFISSYIDFLISYKVIPNQALKQLIEEIPDLIHDLANEDEEAIQRTENIKRRFEELKKQLLKKMETGGGFRKRMGI